MNGTKRRTNKTKRNTEFHSSLAQYAFADPDRVIAEDIGHSQTEKRYYCFGKVGDKIMTVCFTYRQNRIRIIGAGYWREGKDIYEKEQWMF